MGTMEANLAYKALKLFKKTLGISQNFSVQIEKNIPVASGLGGGSSDAAAVLVALNKLTGLNLEKEKLSLLAKKIGMDVPFFLESTPCLATHYGEKLTPLKPIKGITFKLLPQESWPTLPVENLDQKTEQMYATLDLEKCGKRLLQTDKLLKGIETGSPVEVLENLHNDFETLLDLDQNTYLSGAGPAVFTATVDNPN